MALADDVKAILDETHAQGERLATIEEHLRAINGGICESKAGREKCQDEVFGRLRKVEIAVGVVCATPAVLGAGWLVLKALGAV